MLITLENQGDRGLQTIVIGAAPEANVRTPDLLEFAKFGEDILHKSKFTLSGFRASVMLTSMDKFIVQVDSESAAYAIYHYFGHGKYKMDLSFSEGQQTHFVKGIAKGE